MSLLFVSNPTSGSADEELLARVRAALGPIGEITSFVASSSETFGDELQAASSSHELVVVAGGDGTFSRSVNALAARDDVTFALIPMGTGNDLATTLRLSDDPVRVAAGLGEGRVRELDRGRVVAEGHDRTFVNACVGGFSVAVDEALEEETKKKLGRFAFWLGGLKAASDVTRYRVRVDDRQIEDVVVVGIGNGRTVGGGLELWPEADPEDGLLEVCVIAAPELADGVRTALKVKAGSHEKAEGVTMLRGTSIEVEADPPMEINVDGEIVGLQTPARFETSGRFRVLVPPPAGT